MKTNINVKKMAQASILLAFAIILQLIQRNFTQINPILIGPLINTILLLCTYVCGLTYGLILSFLIPIFAILTASLAAPLVPFSPFIIVADIVFVAAFALVMNRWKYGVYIGALLASLVRFAFFTFASTKLIYVFHLALAPAIAKKIGVLFSTPQLLNSLIGSVVAVIIIKALIKRKIIFSN